MIGTPGVRPSEAQHQNFATGRNRADITPWGGGAAMEYRNTGYLIRGMGGIQTKGWRLDAGVWSRGWARLESARRGSVSGASCRSPAPAQPAGD